MAREIAKRGVEGGRGERRVKGVGQKRAERKKGREGGVDSFVSRFYWVSRCSVIRKREERRRRNGIRGRALVDIFLAAQLRPSTHPPFPSRVSILAGNQPDFLSPPPDVRLVHSPFTIPPPLPKVRHRETRSRSTSARA